MALRYGRATTDDLEALGPILALSFGFPPDVAKDWFAKTGIENIRVVRDASGVIGGLLLIPMAQYFGGRSVPTFGVAGVGVSPSARGRGIASDMMRRALRQMRKAGVALSTLYPASIPLYRRAGYDVAGAIWQYSVAGRDVPIHPPVLAVRSFVAADERRVRAVYAAQACQRNGWIDRGPYVWDRTRRERDGKPTYGHVFEKDKRVEGFVFYRHKSTELGFELRVSDMAACSPEGFSDVISFLGSHKSLADAVKWYGGIDDPWLQLMRDRHYAMRLHHHWMLRIVDIPAALAARGYPRDLDVSLTLDVKDDVMPAQSGGYRLRISGGQAQVRRGGKGGIALDVRTLAAIYSSHLQVHAAAKLGLITGRPAALDRAASLFAGPAPSMNDLF